MLTRKRCGFWVAAGGALLSWCAQAGSELPVVRWEGRTMGSPYTVQVAGVALDEGKRAALRKEVEEELEEVNRQMSNYRAESELSRFNRWPAREPLKVSKGFAEVVRFTLRVAERSEGALDPTLGPVINLWGFGEEKRAPAVPDEERLRETLRRVGYRHLRLTERDELVKEVAELTLNLGAVAKGYGTDRMVRVLARHGLTNVWASIAGDVRVMGRNARGTKWQVGISAPVENWREDDPMAAVVSLSDQAISTSGDYQKFFVDSKGRRLCHIFDARTGWPVQHNVGSVSVVAPDSMTADALSTTLFVLGPVAGMKFLEGWKGTEALFIVREETGEWRQVASPGFPREKKL